MPLCSFLLLFPFFSFSCFGKNHAILQSFLGPAGVEAISRVKLNNAVATFGSENSTELELVRGEKL